MENKEMPLVLVVELAKEEIVKSINEVSAKYHLPFYLLDNILNGIANNVSMQDRNELAIARQKYEEELKAKEVKKEAVVKEKKS